MAIEWIFLLTVFGVFAFCMFRWITFGFRFGGNKFVPPFWGLLIFITSLALLIGLHLLVMDSPFFISRFYYDPDWQLANVIFVSVTCAAFVIFASEFIRTRMKRKRLQKFDEIETIGNSDNL